MLRRVLIYSLLLAAVFLLAAGYFFLTGSFFLSRILTPWISERTGCPMEVRRAAFVPSSRKLILYDFRLGYPDAPYLTVRRARGRVDLWALCRGRFEFDDVELTGAVLSLTPEASAVWDRGDEGVPKEKPKSGASSGVPLLIGHARAEDSRIDVVIRDARRNIRWTFDGVSAAAANLTNGGVMDLKCHSPFRVRGRHGMDFSGELEWNGSLALDNFLCLSGVRGLAMFGGFTGRIDRHELEHSAIRCAVDIRRDRADSWRVARFHLDREHRQSTTGVVDMSGVLQTRPYRYELDVRRTLLTGRLLTLLADLGCGVRPGDMRVDMRGTVRGDADSFAANVDGRIEREAGPAFFGEEKIDLPDCRLIAKQDFLFDWRSRRVELRRVGAELYSGGQLAASIRKTDDHGDTVIELNGLSLDLLQFLNPDLRGVGVCGGTVTGHAALRPGAGADTLAATVRLRVDRTALRTPRGRSLPFDGTVNGRFFLSLAGGMLKIEQLTTEILRGGVVCGHIGSAGAIPLRRGRAELDWRVEADPAKLLPLFPSVPSPAADAVARFAPLSLTGGGKCRFDDVGVTLKDLQLMLTGREDSCFRLSMPEHRIARDPLSPDRPWEGIWRMELPAALLPTAGTGPEFSGGACRLRGRWSVADAGGADITLSCESAWQNLTGKWNGNALPALSGTADLVCRYSPAEGCMLNRGTLVCRTEGHPALRLESSGGIHPKTGEFRGELLVRYANERLTDILLPGLIREGQFSGGCRFAGNTHEKRGTGSVSLRIEKLLSTGAVRPVDGELQCDFQRLAAGGDTAQGRLTLTRDGGQLADLRLEMRGPADLKAPVELCLSSEKLDLQSCYEQFAGMPESGGSGSEVRRTLDFGPRAKRVRLKLKNMQWGGAHSFALTGDLQLERTRMRSRNLVLDLDRGRISGRLDGMDFPTGMMLAASGRIVRPVDLSAVAALLYPGSGISGTVPEGEWSLNFRRLFTPDWGGDLVGACRLRFAGVMFPVEAANGPLSRLLLLPVETVVRADKLIPSSLDICGHFKELWRHRLGKDSPFSRLSFTDGELRMSASDGALRVERMQFAGDPLSRMLTKGTMNLRSPYELKLDSEVSLCGAEAKIPVEGTFADPRVSTWKVLAKMPGETLNCWFDVIAHPDGDQPMPDVPALSPFVRMLRDLVGFRSR